MEIHLSLHIPACKKRPHAAFELYRYLGLGTYLRKQFITRYWTNTRELPNTKSEAMDLEAKQWIKFPLQAVAVQDGGRVVGDEWEVISIDLVMGTEDEQFAAVASSEP
jgi:hypothetical protein